MSQHFREAPTERREQPRRGGAGTTPDREGDIVVVAPGIEQGSPHKDNRWTKGKPMTAQPTTRISTSTPPFGPQGQPGFGPPQGQPPFGPQGQQQPPYVPPQPQAPYYGPPPQQPAYGGPQSYGPGYPPAFTPPPAPPAAPRRSTGKTVGIVAAVLVVLGALAGGALLLFGPRSVDPQSVQQEIVRITQTAVQVAPADVRCPDKIKAQAGGTFVCTATVEQQRVTYNVRQDDAKGHLTITYDRILKLADLQSTVADKVGRDVNVPVQVACEPAGRTVVVNAPGTPIPCTATNSADPNDTAKITVNVPADGNPTYTFA